MRLTLTYAALWVVLAIVAIVNGAIRMKVYAPAMSELSAHQLSTLSGLILFSLCIGLFTGIWPIATAGQALRIGVIWLAMTILFEFIFGHYVMGHSWSRLLHDYNFLQGRLWLLVLAWTAIAPWVFFHIRS
ncbi:MAG: hypothetical protein ABW076_00150 [Candidatus Thiodiazotropha sp.]